MSFKKNDIITVITVAGEYVGKYVDESPAMLEIGDPKMLVSGEQVLDLAQASALQAKIIPSL